MIGFNLTIDGSNALSLVGQFDCVVDCTDNVATRYLLNDACHLACESRRVPLVSGAALRWDGQVTVYISDSSCYRCVHPKPPAPETVTNCSDGGVIGAVCGVIGAIQATETIKILAGINSTLSGKMIIYDGLRGDTRTIKMRPKRPECPLCGTKSITQLVDYVQFCGAGAHDKDTSLNLLDDVVRLSPSEVQLRAAEDVIIDVRPPTEFDICRLPLPVLNYPLKKLTRDTTDFFNSCITENTKRVIFVCRRGNDSQRAAQLVNKATLQSDRVVKAVDMRGGLYAWNRDIDPTFPLY